MPDQAASNAQAFNDFVQIGVIVQDLDRTLQVLSDVFGLGPFRTITYPPADRDDIQLTFHGEPAHFSHRIAFAELGPIELEVIQPLTGESGLTEFLAQHGEGIHHIRFNVTNLESALDYLADHDIRPVTTGPGLRPGTQWVHLDTESKIGFTIEIVKVLPGTTGRTPDIADGKVQL